MRKQALATALAAAILGTGLAACGGDDDDGGGGGGGKQIALLLPETKTTRFEANSRPAF
jgi:D-xylose transport system substrate-binding protein